MAVHPDMTAFRAVDACGGTFPKAKNDYDAGWQAGHEAALDAAMEAVRPVDALMAEMLEALKKLTFMSRTSGGTPGPDADLKAACDAAEAAIAKATGADQ